MTTYRYSSALSYFVLAAIGLFCLINTDKWTVPYYSFLILFTKALLGFWRWGNPVHGEKITRIYRTASIIQTSFSIPFITTTLWLNYDYNKYWAYTHSFLGIIPILLYFFDKSKQDLIDILQVANTVSLGCVSLLETNYWGLAASTSFGCSYYWFAMDNISAFKEIPVIDLFNYSYSFIVYFAFKAVQE